MDLEDELYCRLKDRPSDDQIRKLLRYLFDLNGEFTEFTEDTLQLSVPGNMRDSTPGHPTTCCWLFCEETTYEDLSACLRILELLKEWKVP